MACPTCESTMERAEYVGGVWWWYCPACGETKLPDPSPARPEGEGEES